MQVEELSREVQNDGCISNYINYLETEIRHKDNLLARERAARSKAERMQQHQTFLVEVSRLLACSINYEDTLARVIRLIVPHLADWCVIDLVEANGQIRRVAGAHYNPVKEQLLQELQDRYPLDPNLPHPIVKVIQTGRLEIIPDISDVMLEMYTRDADHQHALHELGTRSMLTVPLQVRGRTLGALSFVSVLADHYHPRELAVAEDLAYRIAMAIDNAQLYREMQEAIQARDHFLSVVAHELKTPLTTLLGYTGLLKRWANTTSTLPTREKRVLEIMSGQVTRFNELIDALLDMSRLRTDRLSLHRTVLDLGELVGQVVEDMQPLVQQHSLTFSNPDTPIVIMGDTVRLQQVVRNLIQNAIKYSPDGGQVHVQIMECNQQAQVQVMDQGIGIPEEALPHLFDSFYRAPNAVDNQINGMGVGLYVVEKLVTLHGGQVEVTSQVGQGSTFTVCLPTANLPLMHTVDGNGRHSQAVY